ncbi:MAG: thioredoxin domain-containing protein [Deltaproteobacteria bacterium]|nr:thioredoxin domain-containing protein [Deltaproteobacteria bacterium]
MFKRTIIPIFILLMSISGMALSYMLVEEYYFGSAPLNVHQELAHFSRLTSSMCGEESSFMSCEMVAKSKYSKVFNFPVAALGLTFYSILFFLILSDIFAAKALHPPIAVIFFWVVLLGSLADITLLLISIFMVNALCPLCLVTYIFTWLCLGGAIFYLVKYHVRPFAILGAFKTIYQFDQRKSFFKRIFITICILIISILFAYGADYYLNFRLERYKKQREQVAFEKAVEAFQNEMPITMDVEPIMILGDPEAPITIVEISDFLCPYCKKAAIALEQVIGENPGRVKVIFINYPLDMACNPYLGRSLHPGSCLLAAGALCAAEQDRFEEYQSAVFQAKLERPSFQILKELAREAGLMLEPFIRCLADREILNTIIRQVEKGKEYGVRGTPTIFINGKRYRGRADKDWLQKFIDLEWERIKSENP